MTVPARQSLDDLILECEQASAELEGKPVAEILRWAYERFGDGLGMMSALGYSGIALIDHIVQTGYGIEVFFIDTGFHFPETLDLLHELQNTCPLEIKVLKPSISIDELQSQVGEKPWEANPDLCCHHMKVEPLLRVLHTKKAWLSAIRRDQSSTRAGVDIVEVDGRGTIKIYPFANWSFERTWNYIKERSLIYNKLHDQGFFSIGCVHCTKPVKAGEHERSGRWHSMPKLECGLHSHRK